MQLLAIRSGSRKLGAGSLTDAIYHKPAGSGSRSSGHIVDVISVDVGAVDGDVGGGALAIMLREDLEVETVLGGDPLGQDQACNNSVKVHGGKTMKVVIKMLLTEEHLLKRDEYSI
jgi:hypothetical protein